MKKNLFLAALAVVAMASCSKNEAVDSSYTAGTSAISFDTFIERATKGSVATTTTLQSDGFGVIGYNSNATTPAITFSNEPVSYANGSWSYAKSTVYWATGDDISFYAYAPYDTDAVLSVMDTAPTSGVAFDDPKLTVTTAETIAAQTDMLVATSLDNEYDADNGASPINLEFNHILSKIGFTAQAGTVSGGDDDIADITLKSVSVAVDDLDETYNGLISEADYNMATSAWEFVTDAAASRLSVDSAPISTTTIDATAGVKLIATATNVTDADKYLMIIPQTLDVSDVVNITVTYVDNTNTGTDLEKTVSLPAMTFAEGKQYTFNLIIGDEAIRFGSVTVTDWVDGTGTDL